MAFFSTNSVDYVNAISGLKKPKYESKYDNTISQIMDKIANKEEFSYDFNADEMYQNYKDQYTKLGKEAAMNAAGAVSAQTGGFGNSYAASAAAQANQQYLTQLNNVIPELREAALNNYQLQLSKLRDDFSMYQSEENRLYGQYRDSVSDYYNDLNTLTGGYNTAVGNEQWNKQFDYQKQRDAISDAQWEKQYQLSLYNAHKGSTTTTKKAKADDTTTEAPVTSKLEKDWKSAERVFADLESYASKYKATDTTQAKKLARKEERIKELYNAGEINEADMNYLWKALGINPS